MTRFDKPMHPTLVATLADTLKRKGPPTERDMRRRPPGGRQPVVLPGQLDLEGNEHQPPQPPALDDLAEEMWDS